MSIHASFVALEEEINVVNSKKKTQVIFGILVVFVAFMVLVKFIIDYWGRKDEIIHEVGVSLPEIWYYNRSMLNMQPCQEDELVVKENILIGYIDRNCSDVKSCITIIRDIADEANFFIAIDHVFEGYGWKCNVTDTITIKFLGVIDWSETLLYYVLLKDGVANHEISSTMRVLIDKTSCHKDDCILLLHLGALQQ